MSGQEWKNEAGQLHRLDGPAIIFPNGRMEWYVNGNRHRIDGPAIIWSIGTQEWWVNDERHRIDGPAVIWSNGYRDWWCINGKDITDDVITWIHEYNIPEDYTKWTDLHHVLFRIRF